MRNSMLVAVVAVLLQAPSVWAQAPEGDARRGQGLYFGAEGGALCGLCHGRAAEGGYGPDLAGRQLSFAQFKKAVQNPWSLMPRYPYITEQGLADLYAYLQSLPQVDAPGGYNVASAPPGSPLGQALMIEYGCGQCHGPEIGHPRRDIGEKDRDIDYEAFARLVYELAPQAMGLFNPKKLSEPVLREIWDFMEDMGQRAFLWADMDAGMKSGDNTTYTLTLENRGRVNSGLTAGDITVSLRIPEGISVVNATGGSYEGMRENVETVTTPGQLAPFRGLNPNPNVQRANVDFATWAVDSVAAGEEVTLSVTLSGGGDATPDFSGSRITFNEPQVRRLENVTLTDDRLADQGDILWGPSSEWSMPRPER